MPDRLSNCLNSDIDSDMLRSIVLKNFVHFNEKTVIVLNDAQKRQTVEQPTNTGESTSLESNALNIFVGANFCGKSTVLELIRRCMTDEINVSITSSFDEKKIAYAFCLFDLSTYGEIISGIIKDPDTDKMCKVFIFKDRSLLRLKLSDKKTTFSCSFEEEEYKQVITSILNINEDETSDGHVRHILKKIERSEIESISNEPNWKTLEDKFIATFPLRGIGSVQWTRSKRIGKEHKAENYKTASERAEIISTLLSPENYNKYISESDETRIFNFLTYPEIFKFENVSGEIKVQHDGPQFDLLKTSEGIIEAKVASLLLALKDNETLCLEDPDRGMHPQMIERLKTVLYDSARHRTIIVVTHSPYFIDSITVHKTHVFVRNRLYEPYICSVLNVGDNLDLSRVTDIETLRILLFATKVLLVEGPIDREVVQTILTQNKLAMRRISEKNEEKKRDYFTENISTHQIIPIWGCDNVDKVQAFCDFIDLPCLCLLDRDKAIKRHKGKTTFWGKRKDKGFIEELEKKYCKDHELSLDYEEYIETLKLKLKQTKSPRKCKHINEIINFRRKEKKDEDMNKYIEGLAGSIRPEISRKREKFRQKRNEEEKFDTYMDKLHTENGDINPTDFWTEKKEKFEEYLEYLQSNRKTFVWRNGTLEDAILSSENYLDIVKALNLTEQGPEEEARNIFDSQESEMTANRNQSSQYVTAYTGQETTEDETPSPPQCIVNSNKSDISESRGQSSENFDATAKPYTKPGTSQKAGIAKLLKQKLTEGLDNYTRQELCKLLMGVEEIQNFIKFMAEEEIRP